MTLVRTQAIGDVLLIEIQNPPINAGSLGVRQAHLLPTTDWTRLAAADLVIEAVFEDLAVKQDVFRKIDAHARPGACWPPTPRTSTWTRSPTPPHARRTCWAFGFIGNRIYNAYRQQCEFMLEDGAWPEDVDQALQAFGFAMGPFSVADLSGLDIAWRMRTAQAATRDPRARYVSILDQLCEQGRLGRKTGAGYYTHTDGRQDKVIDATVRSITRRQLAGAEIQRRALLAMVNEAALLLAQGVAQRPSDIDVVLVSWRA